MTKSTFSIVVPVLDEPLVGRTLDSIFAQKDVGIVQVIVIDGGSAPETVREIEDRSEAIDIFVSEPDRGLYDAMNKGVRLATGDIVGIINSDDYYSSNEVLKSVLAAFERSNCDGVYGDLDLVRDDWTVTRRWRSGKFNRIRCYFGWIPPHPAVFLKRKIYSEFGRFNTDFRISADYEMLIRLILKHKLEFTYVNEVLVNMRPGGTSNGSLSAIIRGNAEAYRAWRVNDIRWGFAVPLLKPISKMLQVLSAYVLGGRRSGNRR